jgi:lipopolysaccharide transport system ATP-binding protein
MPLAIKVENLSKQYRLGQIGTGTISHDLNRFWASLRGKEDPYAQVGSANDRTQKAVSDYVWALKDINFEIEQGDAVGIIGRNGAGKSTLLKILSRTTLPTTGSVKMKGRIASLLEVGTGFHPEMTGRENIYQNGAILGMTRHEITRKFDEIVDFSGCEAYIDTPVKRYSSGMYVRLAFAVAAHLESEILIVDEVLAVGDAEFQKKCLGKMNDVAKWEGRTVLFVSHNMSAVKNLCNKGILLDNGRLHSIQEIDLILKEYAKRSDLKTIYDTSKYWERKRGVKSCFIKSLEFDKSIYYPNSQFIVSISLDKKQQMAEGKLDMAVFVFDGLNNVIFHLSTLQKNLSIDFTDSNKYRFIIDNLTLNKGIYHIGVWVCLNGIEQDYADSNMYFEVGDESIYENKTINTVSIIQQTFHFQVFD